MSSSLGNRMCPSQIRACEDLLAFVKQRTDPWSGRPIAGDGADMLLATLQSRSTTTFQAAIGLGRQGFPENVMMLVRSLCDDFATGYWIDAKPDVAHERAERFHRFQRVLVARRRRADPDLYQVLPNEGGDGDVTPGLDPEDEAALVKRFGKNGLRGWTGEGIQDRFQAAERRWADAGEDPIALRIAREVIMRDASDTLHPSLRALSGQILGRRMQDGQPQVLVVRSGPSGHDLDQALLATYYMFAGIVGLMSRTFELCEHAELHDLHARTAPMFDTLNPEQLRDTSRNEACPCGSGRKFKQCHSP